MSKFARLFGAMTVALLLLVAALVSLGAWEVTETFAREAAGSTAFTPARPGSADQRVAAAASEVSASTMMWSVQAVEAPKLFKEMTDRSLAVDGNGRPHIAYGGDHLYYAYYEGSKWVRETVDASPGVGAHASIAVTGTNPVTVHIAYYDALNEDLKYARKGADGRWQITTVDTAGGKYTSIALDGNGRPHISYAAIGDLKYAYWDGSQWVRETVNDDWAQYTSLALTTNGAPQIAYYDWFDEQLKYVQKAAGSWTVPDVLDKAGQYVSLALNKSNVPYISYLGEDAFGSPELKHAYYSTTWNQWITETVTAGYTPWTSIAMDGSDSPHISYNDSLDHAYIDGTGTWNTERVDSSPGAGLYTSIAIAPSAAITLHVSYYDQNTGNLMYAYLGAGGWVTQTVDSGSADVGRSASIALDANDVPHISYLDRSANNLRYASLSGTVWVSQTVDANAAYQIDGFTSLAMDGNGSPRIGYVGSIKYARWDGTKWLRETVRSGVALGEYGGTSLALEPTAPYTPHLSFYDGAWNAYDLIYARWNGTQWVSETVESAGKVGKYSSLALDSNGYPRISYYYEISWNKGHLRYARWDGSKWITETVDSAGDVGEYSSLALDAGGNPHIAYYDAGNADLKYASWNGSGWVTQTVDSAGTVGEWASLDLDAAGRPHIAYYNRTSKVLRYAYWDGSTWVSQTVDGNGVGADASLALDSRGNAHIAYYDAANADLKYAYGRRVGAAMTGGQSASPAPGQSVVYTHLVTNTGTATDTFDVAFSSSQGWASIQPGGPITLAPGASTRLSVTVTVPANAISGTVETSAVTVTSRTTASVQLRVNDTTTAGHLPGVGLAPNRSGQALPGRSAVYTHTLTNTGNGADTFSITCAGTQGWTVQCAPSSVALARGASATVRVTVTVPAGTISGTVETTIVTATSQADAAVRAAVTDTTTAIASWRVYLPLVKR